MIILVFVYLTIFCIIVFEPIFLKLSVELSLIFRWSSLISHKSSLVSLVSTSSIRFIQSKCLSILLMMIISSLLFLLALESISLIILVVSYTSISLLARIMLIAISCRDSSIIHCMVVEPSELSIRIV
jgi:hypothetical protein